MKLSALVFLAQIAAPAQERMPVLTFPEPGLDDTAAYQGYVTRFYRDSHGNTVQIYLDRNEGRVVNLWADAANESIGFTARTPDGTATPLIWGSVRAQAGDSARTRWLEYDLVAQSPQVQLGWFLLGSMRVERDFQYWEKHRAPFSAEPFELEELRRLIDGMERLPRAERDRHLGILQAGSISVLRARLHPTVSAGGGGTRQSVRMVQPSFDVRNFLALEISVDSRRVLLSRDDRTVTLRARSGDSVPFRVRISTDAEALTPLNREQIFTPEFLGFLAQVTGGAGASGGAQTPAAASDTTSARARRLERQVRGVELLSSREKLMAGLPNFATYFGRDMMMSALMMRSIWSDESLEHVIASVLRKLSPSGQVSHEEALGGQAIREAAAEYAALVDQYMRATAGGDTARARAALDRATNILTNLNRTRENYHMLDDEFQLPVLTAIWITDEGVPAARKLGFLLDRSDGEPRVTRLLRELALVSRMTAPYAARQVAENLVAFPKRDSIHFFPGSWRDSNAGYANGRFAMDINAIWAPLALERIGAILRSLRELGLRPDSILASAELASVDAGQLAAYSRDTLALSRAVNAWRGAWRHFLVTLPPAEVRQAVTRRVAALPERERRYWMDVLARTGADRDSLAFLALSLDSLGRPIPVANTDPATRLMLENLSARVLAGSLPPSDVLRDVRLFVRPFPVGLFVQRLGPLAANDAYATPETWAEFERDRYHGPRVVWGREVNLFLLGVANEVAVLRGAPASSLSDPAVSAYLRELEAALELVHSAVQQSGLGQRELWSYSMEDGRLHPRRFGFSSDVQLWSTTDLAVQFALWRLARLQ